MPVLEVCPEKGAIFVAKQEQQEHKKEKEKSKPKPKLKPLINDPKRKERKVNVDKYSYFIIVTIVVRTAKSTAQHTTLHC